MKMKLTTKKIVFVSSHYHDRIEMLAEIIILASNNKPHLILLTPPPTGFANHLFETLCITTIENLPSTVRNYFPCHIHNITKVFDISTISLLQSEIHFHYDYKDVLPANFKPDYTGLDAHIDVFKLMTQRSIPFSFRDGQAHAAASIIGVPPPVGYHLPEVISFEAFDTLSSSYVPYRRSGRRRDIVFIGNFSLEKLNPEQGGHGQLLVVKTLLSQKFSYTIYEKQTSARSVDDFSEYLDLQNSHSKFHFHSTIPRRALSKALKEFGWGSLLFPLFHYPDCSEKTFCRMPWVGISGRLSDYFGAGLPILSSSPNREVDDLIECHGVGVQVKNDDLFHLGEIVDSMDYVRLRRNVIDFAHFYLNPKKWGFKLLKSYEEFDK
jgi:hypothetical protein